MIRIDLLGNARQKTRKTASFDLAQQLTTLCGLILVAALAGIGWWYWSLTNESARLDTEIAARKQEAARLQSLLGEVQRFEAQRTQLQQRVQLIEQLRGGQAVPVQLLDHVSRSLPDMMWLTDMTQEGGAVVIKGRSTTLIGLSDFVGNLANTALLKKPIEIVDSQVDSARTGGPGNQTADLIQFTVKAELASAAPAASAPASGRGAAPPAK
jgi:type IV pilus assembly protein PilN